MSDKYGIGSLVSEPGDPLFGGIDGSPSIRSVLDYKAPTFAESMADFSDAQLDEMEANGAYYSAQMIRTLRPAARKALGRDD